MSSTTIVTIDEAHRVLSSVDTRRIKDVRALDVDLLVVLDTGDVIVLRGGAVRALLEPDLPLEFANGYLALGGLFQQVDRINVSPEAQLSANSGEITRYKKRAAKSVEDEEQDKPLVALPEEKPAPVVSASTSVNKSAELALPPRPPVDVAPAVDALEAESEREGGWGLLWPAVGLLALGGAAGGSSSGGDSGSGGGSGGGGGGGSGPLSAAELSGWAVLNHIDNATVRVYGAAGQLLGSAQINGGEFKLTLSEKGYQGVLMLVVSDDNDAADNYTDEVTGERRDVGEIRAMAVATGGNQVVHVTALTELAVLKAGVQAGILSPAGLSAEAVKQHNLAVAKLFQISDLLTERPVTTVTDTGERNPLFSALSPAQQHYGAALHAISLLEKNRDASTDDVLEKLSAVLRLNPETNRLVWNGSVLANELQSDLYSERQTTPVGQEIGGDYGTIKKYLETNKVAFSLPDLVVKNANPSVEEPWQSIAPGQTLRLDKGDFAEGSLGVKGPPGTTVTVKLSGRSTTGADMTVNLGSATVGPDGLAIFKITDEAILKEVSQLDSRQKAQATVTVTDGENTRSNTSVWQPADVRVDFVNVPVTRITSLSLLDTGYAGSGDTATERGNAPFGQDDNVASRAAVTGRLTQSLRSAVEKLQFSVDGGNTWADAPALSWNPDRTVFTATGLSQANQALEIKARVVLFGPSYSGGLGNANEFTGTVNLTLDTAAPDKVVFEMVGAGDDGLSSVDQITVTPGQGLDIASGLESNADVTLRLLIGRGEGTGTLQRTRGGQVEVLAQGEWHTYVAGDLFSLLGDTVEGTGKIVLTTRQIDKAGNATSNTQTFVVDSRSVVDHVVALAQAAAEVKAAQNALASIPLTDPEARRAAEKVLEDAVAAQAVAKEDTLRALLDPSDANAVRMNELGLKDANGTPLTITPATLPLVLDALAATQDPNKVNTKPALAALVAQTLADIDTALGLASAYDGNNTPPALSDFPKMGVQGVTPSNLPSVLSALAVLPPDKSDSTAEVQAAVDAYDKLLEMADGQANTDSPTTPADYAAIGVQPALSPSAAALLGEVIDRKNPADIDTVAEIAALAEIANRIAEQAALPEGSSTTPPLTVSDFEKLGLAGVNEDNLADVARGIARTPNDGSGVDTLAEVRELIDAVIADLKFIIDYADTPAGSGSSPAPLLIHYRNGGLTPQEIGDGTNGSVNNIASINDAVKGLKGTDVGSWNKVKALVASYNTILAAADGVANGNSVPTAQDYTRIGVTNLDDAFPLVEGTPDPAKANALSLLNNAVDAAARAAVDTVAEVRDLASIAARVVEQAAGETVNPPLTAADLNKLKLSPPVTEATLPLVLAAIKGTADDGSGVTTPAKIAQAVQAAQAAQNAITQYAGDSTAPPPTLEQYRALGLDVEDQATADALNSILASPSITPGRVDTPAEIKALVDAYAKIRAQTGDADSSSPDPTPSDYASLGVDVPPTTAGNALLNDALARMPSTEVVTLPELNALIAAANAITALAAGDTSRLAGSTPEEKLADLQAKLSLLGVTDLEPASLASLQAAIIATPDSGVDVDTVAELQALADAVKTAQQTISDYADANGGTPPTAEQYAVLGVTGLSPSNTALLDAVNAALASEPVTRDKADSPQELQAIVDGYGRILAAADGGARPAAALPTAADYAAVGVSPAPAAGSPELSLLNQVVDKAPAAAVNTPEALSKLADTVGRLMDLAAGNEPTPPLTKEELEALGLTGLTDKALASVLQAIEASPNNGSGIDTLSELQALADSAKNSAARIEAYAQNNTGTAPTEADYRNVGLVTTNPDGSTTPLVNSSNLSAINNALASQPIEGQDVSTPQGLQAVVDAYKVILDYANGSAADSGTQPTEDHYQAVGVDLGKPSVGLMKDGVMDEPAFKLFTEAVGLQQDAGVDSPAEIEALAATAADILRTAREVPTEPVSAPLTLARLQGLGLFPGVSGSTSLNDSKVAAFLDAVKATPDTGLEVDTLAELQNLADAVNTILNHAADISGAPVPTMDDYTDIGATVPVTAPATEANVLAALNNAVKAAAPGDVDSISEINALAALVDKLMQVAAGVDPDTLSPALTPEDLGKLGIRNVDTPAKLAAVLEKIASTPDDGSALTNLPALQSLSNAALAAQEKIRAYADRVPPVPTTGTSVPTLADFEALGLSIPSSATATQAQNLALVLSALASTPVTGAMADTPEELQALIGAAQKVLQAANGMAGDADQAVTAETLTSLGVNPGKLAAPGAMSLLADVIDASSADKVNTIPLIEGLLDRISALMAEAAGTGTQTDAQLKALLADLNAIPKDASGTPTVDLDGNWAAIREAIKASRDDGSAIDTLEELQALIQKASDAQDTIRDYAATGVAPTPTLDDYAAIGLVNTAADGSVSPLVTADKLGALNSVLASAAVGAEQAKTPALIKQLVDTYNKILDEANGPDTPDANPLVDPLAADYRALGADVEGVTKGTANPMVLSLLNDLIGNTDAAGVDTIGEINALGALANKVQALAALSDTAAMTNPLNRDDLAPLGLSALSDAELAALNAAIKSKTPGDVDSLAEIVALADGAKASLEKIAAYAADNTGDRLGVPTATDFANVGVVNVRATAGSLPANLAAVLAALATGSVDGSRADTPAKLQGIVDSFSKVLSSADGVGGNTGAAATVSRDDYVQIGVDLGTHLFRGMPVSAQDNAVSLLSSLIDSKTRVDVDTPAEIEALAAVVRKVVLMTGGTATSPGLSPADFGLLGINGVTDDNLDEVLAALTASADDASDVKTLGQLGDVVGLVADVPVLNLVASDNIINSAEKVAGVTLTGTAPKDSSVFIRFGSGAAIEVLPTPGTGTTSNWTYTITNSNYTSMGADGDKTLTLWSVDAAGKKSVEVTRTIKIDTTVATPTLKINDTGLPSDGITSDPVVTVEGLEAGATWEYSTDAGTTWTAGTGNSFTLPSTGEAGSSYAASSVQVRQTDAAGNRNGDAGLPNVGRNATAWTVDTQAPSTPTVAYGPGMADGATAAEARAPGALSVTAEAGSTVQVVLSSREDPSKTVTKTMLATGVAANVPALTAAELATLGDGTIDVRVTATDRGGNVSEPATSSFALDTQTPTAAPTANALSADTGSSSTDFVTNTAEQTITGTFSGTLAADEQIQVSVDGTNWVTATVAGSAWTAGVRLLEGTNNLQLRSIDAAGNASSIVSKAYTLDTAAPTVTPSITALSADTGADSSDFVTSTGLQTVSGSFMGTLGRDESIQVSADNGITWVTALVSGATWTASGVTLSAGTNTLQVRALDAAGNATTAVSRSYTFQTSGPAVTASISALSADTGADNTDFVTNTASQTVTGTFTGTLASDQRIQVSSDGGSTWVDASTADNRWTASGLVLVAGNNTLQVRAIDAAGNTTPGASKSYTLDTAAPTVTPSVTRFSADTGSSSSDYVTNTVSQTITGSFSGTLGAGEDIQVSADGTNWVTATVAGSVWTASGISLLEGENKIQMRAIDKAGNATAIVNHLYTLDTAAPAVTLSVTALSADTGTNTTDFITNVAVQTISGTFTGTLAGGEVIEVSADNGTTWVGATTAGSTWSASGITLSVGANSLQVRALDRAGNATAVVSRNYTYETAGPAVTASITALSTDTGVLATDFVTSVARQTVTGTFTGTLASDQRIQVSVDGVNWVSATTSGNEWSVADITLSAGVNTLQVRAIDAAGNTTLGASKSYTLDTTAPTATASVSGLSDDTGLSNSDFITNTAAQTVSGSLAGVVGSDEEVQVSVDGSTWVKASVSGTTWTASGLTLAEGSNNLQVRTIDAAGNVTAGVSRAYTLDTAAPTVVLSASGLSADTGASSSDFITNTALQTISGVFTGTLASGERVQVSLDGGITWQAATVAGNSWTVAGVTLQAGTHNLQMRSIDTAGNASTPVVRSYTLDTTAPSVTPTITALSADTGANTSDFITSTASQTVSGRFTGTLGDGETIEVSADGSTWVVASITGNTWTASGLTLLAGPGNSLRARVLDTAGNVTTPVTQSYTLQTTGPSVAPTITALSSDTGALNNDFITSTAVQTVSGTFTGTLASDQSIEVSADAGTTWVRATTSGTTWTAAGVTLVSGSGASLQVRAIDAAGNTTAGPSRAYTLDTTAPVATASIAGMSDDTGALATDFITNVSEQTLTGSLAGELGADERVQVSADGGTTWVNASTSGSTWTADVTLLAGSGRALQVRTIDTAGNTTAGANQNYTLDTTAPTAAPSIGALSSDTGTNTTDFITSTAAQTVTGSFTGTLASSERIQVSADGGATWVNATTTGSSWSASGITLLTGTGRSLQARVVDTAGNSTTPVTQNYTLQTSGPAVTATITALSSDTGALNNDFITNTAVQTVSGTFTGILASDQSIEVSADGGTTWVRATTVGATWSATGITLAAGADKVLQVRAIDAAGNTTAGPSKAYTLDTTAPVATAGFTGLSDDTGALNNDFITSTAAQTVSGTFTGALGADERVQVSVDGGATWVNATATGSTDGSWTANVTLLTGTGRTLQVRTIDTAGNVTAGANQSYTLDATAPAAVAAVSALGSDSGSSGSDFITNVASQAVTGTFTGTLSSGERIQVSADGGTTWVNAVTSGSNWTADVTLQTGTGRNLQVRTIDTAGNTTAGAGRAYTLDTTAPTATASVGRLSDDTGALSDDFITSKAAQTLTGSLAGALGADERVQVSADGGTTWVNASTSGSTWTADVTLLAGSGRALQVRTIDTAGNTTAGANQNYTLDTTAPTAAPSIGALSSDTGTNTTDFITSTAAQTVTGSFTGTLASSERIQVSADGGATWVNATTTGSSWSASGITLLTGPGRSLQARVVDTAGNSTTPVTQNYTLQTSGPAVTATITALSSDTGLSNTDFVTNSAVQTVSGTFTGTLASDQNIEVSADGGTTWVRATTVGATWSAAGITLSAGADKALQVRAIDAAGNATAGPNKAYVLDNGSPTATPTITGLSTDSGALNNDFITNTATQTVAGTFTGTLGADERIQVSVDGGTTWVNATSLGATDGTWTVSGITLAAGSGRVLQVRTSDTAGNVKLGVDKAYTLDNNAPTATASITALGADTGSSNADFITSSASQTVSGSFTGTLGTDDRIQVSADGGTTWVNATTSGSNWTATGVTLATGTGRTLQVRTIDTAGNSVAGTSKAYTLDTSAPSATATITALSADTGSVTTDFITNTAAQTVSGTFTGTLGADEQIQVSADGGTTWVNATATGSSGGTWSASGLTLAAGTGRNLQVRTIDTAGNTTAGANKAYTLDTAAPTATATVTALGTDTGSSNTDFITSTASQTVTGTFTGTLATGESIQVSADGGTTWVNATTSGTNWTATGVTLQTGTGRNLQVRTIDTAGNATAGANKAYTLDTTAPTATATVTALSTDTGSSNTDFITSTAAQTVSGTFTGTLATGESIQVSADGGTTWVNATTSGTNWTATSVTLQTGTGRNLQVRTIDTAGNTTAGANKAYTLDTTAPTATATVTALSADNGSSSTDFITNTAAQTVNGTFTGTLAAGESIQVSADSGTTWVNATTSGTNWTATGVTLQTGTGRNLQVRTIDTAGNVKTGTDKGYTLDTVAPTVLTTALLSDTGSSATDGITRSATVRVDGVESQGQWQYQVGTGAWINGRTRLNDLTVDMFGGTINGGWVGGDKTVNKVSGLSAAGGTTRTVWLLAWDGSFTRGVQIELSEDSNGRLQARVIKCMLAINTDQRETEPSSFPSTTDVATSDDSGQSGLKVLLIKGAQVISNYVGKTNTATIDAFALTSGAQTYNLRHIDVAGNTTNSPAVNYTLDTTAPTATAAITALSADTGTSNSDFITNTTAQTVSGTFTGTLGAGEEIQVSADGGTTWVKASTTGSNWTATGVTLATGTGRSVQVRTIDTAGNATALVSKAYTLDTTAPTATATVTALSADTGSSTTDFITNTAAQTVSGTFTGTLASGETIQVSVDGTTWVNATASGSSWTATGLTLATGTGKTLQVRTIDAAGNATAVVTKAYTLDTTAPTVTPTITALSSDTGINTNDFITSVAAQTVSGTFTGTLGADEKIQVSADGGTTWLDATSTGSSWTVAGITLSTGTGKTLQARVIDTAGNATAVVSKSYALETTGPAVTATITALSADTGALNTDFITSTALQTVSGTFTGTLGSGQSIQVSADGGTTWVNATATGSTWSAAGVTLAAGTGRSLQVRAIDSAGNTTAGVSKAYTFDNTAPTVTTTITGLSSDTGTSNSDFITNTTAQTVNGTFTGTLGAGEEIQVSADGGTTWVKASTTGSNWTATGVTLATGTGRSVQVRTIDTAGNATALVSKAYTLDTTAPTATATVTALSADTGSSTTDFITNTASQTVSGTFTGTLAAGESIQVSADGGTTWVNATTSGTNWTATGVTLQTGTGRNLQVRTIDTAGNSAAGTSKAYTLDTSAPSATATITALSADTGSVTTDFITNTAAQTVSGTFTGTLAAGETIQVSADGGTTWLNATTSGTNWTATGVTLATGTGRNLQVRTIDTAGNTTAGANKAYTLDTTAPTATATVTALGTDTGSSATDFITNTASQTVSGTFTGTVASGENIQVSADGGTTWVNATTSGSNWTATGVTLATGTGRNLQVRTIDTAGNTLAGTAKAYTLDTTAPTAAATITALSADTGSSNSDFITRTAAQTVSGSFTGTLGADEKIQVSVNGTTWLDATVTGSNWTASGVTLSTGTNNLQVRTVDTAGNTLAGTAKSYTLDTTNPTLSLNTTALTDDVGSVTGAVNQRGASSNDPLPTISGTLGGATAGSALPSGETVNVYRGPNMAGATLLLGTGTTTLQLTGSKIVYTARDALWNPTIVLPESPANGDTVVFIRDSAISFEVRDAAGNVVAAGSEFGASWSHTCLAFKYDSASGKWVDAYELAGTATVTVTASGQSTWTFQETTPLADGGDYIYAAKIVDTAGNSTAYTVGHRVTVDTSAPTVTPAITALSVDAGLSSTDFITNTAAQTVSGAFTGTLGSGENIQVSADGGTTWVNATASGSNWSASVTLVAGTNNLQVRAIDTAGNASAVTSQSYTLETTAPTATPTISSLSSDTGSSSSDFITNSAAQTVSGTFTGTLASDERIQISINGGTTWVNATTSGSTWTASGMTLLTGTGRAVQVRVIDTAGNTRAGSNKDYTLDTSAPTIDIDSAVAGTQTSFSTSATSTSAVVIAPNMGLITDTDVATLRVNVGTAAAATDTVGLGTAATVTLNTTAQSGSSATIGGVSGVNWSYSTAKVLTLTKSDGTAFTAAQLQNIEKALTFTTSSTSPSSGVSFEFVHVDRAGNSASATATVNFDPKVALQTDTTNSGRTGDTATDGNTMVANLLVTNGFGNWQYTLDGSNWETVTTADGTKTSTIWSGVTANASTGVINLSLEGSYTPANIRVRKNASGASSSLTNISTERLILDWFTKTKAQTEILVNGTTGGTDGASDNTLINGSTTGEKLTLDHLGLIQGYQSGALTPENVTLTLGILANLTVFKNSTSVTSFTMKDVLDGVITARYSQTSASLTEGGAFARADFTVSESGWSSSANFTKSLNFKFTNNQALVYGDASGNGGRGDVDRSEGGQINGESGRHADDNLMGSAGNDVIFGDGSGGGGSDGVGVDGAAGDARPGTGGGSGDVIFGGGGNDLLFGDGYSGNASNATVYGGAGGIGGGGGGGGSLLGEHQTTLGGGGQGGRHVAAGESAQVGNTSPGGDPASFSITVGGFGGGVRNGGLNTNAVVVENTSGTVGSWVFKNDSPSGYNSSAQITKVYNDLKGLMLSSLTITSQTPGTAGDRIDGGSGNDMIAGGNGNDTIIGGLGNDIMWGIGGTASGTNNDTFVWQRGDAGTGGATDEVRDFTGWNGTSGMKIDISSLLENRPSGSKTNLSQWITSITTGVSASEINTAMNAHGTSTLTQGGTKIVIDVDGIGAGTVTQTIYLRNFTASTTNLDTLTATNSWLVV